MMKHLLLLATFLCCALAWAVEQDAPVITVACERLLTSAPVITDEVSAALRLFPNETVEHLVPFNPKKSKKGDLPTPFQQAIAKAAETVSFSDFRYLPISIHSLYPGTLSGNQASLDLSDALGKAVVGHSDLVGRPNTNGLYPVERQYFAGVVEGVLDETHTYPPVGDSRGYEIKMIKVIIRTPEGSRRQVLVRAGGPIPAIGMLILSPATDEESLMREAIRASSVEKFFERSFGSPILPEDYSMASAIVDTILSVPPQMGSTTVVKILMGHKVKDSAQYPYFGIARGKERYSEEAIRTAVASVTEYMQTVGVLTSSEKVYFLPVETGLTHKIPLSETFKKIWHDLKAENGAPELEVSVPKPRATSPATLSTSTAVPGMTLVAEQDFAGAYLLDGSTPPVISAGTKLILLTKPRKKHEINLARVKLVDTGEEGEYYWIYLTKWTKIDPSQ